MCGIVAMLSQGGAVRRETLERATRSLHHRGPDDRQYWLDAASTVGLGHTRLGIIDPTGGRQPVTSEDESIRAVVNGELYDFERIRDQLIARGHRFRTNSDSELVVHLYEDHGAALVEHLRGEFAFVLYDAARDLMIAARDRFGIKPLVYGWHHGVLQFASEAKALFAAGMPAAWDAESFAQSTVLGGPLEDRTVFAGIHQLPAGHLLIATRRHHRLVRYWDFDYPVDGGASPRAEADDAAELAEVLDEAVRLRLRADVPVACYLSGGIDSCAVLGFAQRHSAAPLHAFSLAFDHADYDEHALARDMAAHAGAVFTPIPVRQADLAADLEAALYAAERPLNNANSVAKFQLSRAVRDAGIKVVLTGEGSDEIFAGYPHYRRDLLLTTGSPGAGGAERGDAGRLAQLTRDNAVSRGMLLPDGDGLSVASVRAALGGFAPTWVEAFATVGKKVAGVLRPEVASRAERLDPLALFVAQLPVSRQLRGRHPVHQAMYLWSKSVLPNFILSALGDRMEMAHSVEGRLPFLDHRVVELSTRLPIDRLIRGGIEKYLLREVARPVVTDAVYRRHKHPFLAPPASAGDTGTLRELLHDTLRGPALRQSPFFDQARVVALLDSLPGRDAAARTALDGPLMVMLSTVLMQQRFGISDAV
jgi:asparagine synthase (glutamine-hydrolysing)